MTPRLLQHYVTTQAERWPEAVAVISDEATLTYGQLDAWSNQLARALRAVGCRKGSRVCLLAPKSATAIAAMLGVYKADGIYVPLDIGSPSARLRKVIAAASPSCILGAGEVAPLIDELLAADPSTSIAVGWLGPCAPSGGRFVPRFGSDDVSTFPAGPLRADNCEDAPAHILFTSGSTGTPKGAVITHANVIAFTEWAVRYFGIGSADRQSCHSPLHFDLSVFDIFGTLAAGARLYLVDPALNLLPNRLASFIRDHELTQWFSVPALLTYMARLDVVRHGDFSGLRRLLWCGEVLPTPILQYWMQRLPHVTFTNLYGPTETTIASSYYTVPVCPSDQRQPIPIGVPCNGERLLVLGPDLAPLPAGAVGDLYIGGAGLSPGYWQNPDATQAAFIDGPQGERIYRTGDLASVGHDGLAYFHGRADTQIKSRGHRIELGEIEVALHTFRDLRESAVVAVETDGFEGRTLCCAYVPAGSDGVSPAALRRRLGELLPPYMVPSKWRVFSALPKNVNGKIDRPRLVQEFSPRRTRRDSTVAPARDSRLVV